ncbi:hypothetical protein Ahy_A08g039264 [Arachis hypogaea]|uniref:Uncharacterized protein n=1 Tax=Arachis hypogaea TaxID=3818 RepID=A0A445BVS5_ARAHY|nr:hypothetical protein Ahy_A08g039264 [Arachis hypogaea]
MSRRGSSVPSSNCIRTRVLGKLQDCPLTIWPSRLNNDVLRVLDGNNNPSSKLELLPCLAKVNYVNTWGQGIRKINQAIKIFSYCKGKHRKD